MLFRHLRCKIIAEILPGRIKGCDFVYVAATFLAEAHFALNVGALLADAFVAVALVTSILLMPSFVTSVARKI